jgi:hypothetical protein
LLAAAGNADWPRYPAVKRTLPGAGLGRRSGRLIFDAARIKHRLAAGADGTEQRRNHRARLPVSAGIRIDPRTILTRRPKPDARQEVILLALRVMLPAKP